MKDMQMAVFNRNIPKLFRLAHMSTEQMYDIITGTW